MGVIPRMDRLRDRGRAITALRTTCRRWKAVDVPLDTSAYDASDPFCFTSEQAIEDYRAGLFARPDGRPCTLNDLEWDLKTEVMRQRNWSDIDLEFLATMHGLMAEGIVKDTGAYWRNSPHAAVYRIDRSVGIRLGRRTYRLRKGREIAFQCLMARQLLGLRWPFITGHFIATSESKLCGDMSNAMKGLNVRRTASTGSRLALPSDWGDRTEYGPPDLDLNSLRVDNGAHVLYLLLDVSGSMAGSPLGRAKAAVLEFLRSVPPRPDLRVAVRAFNERVGPL